MLSSEFINSRAGPSLPVMRRLPLLPRRRDKYLMELPSSTGALQLLARQTIK
jgi:hypothetical protein